jgi:hypothetical protein
MAIKYFVRICGEEDASGISHTWQPIFVETPRVGEFVAFPSAYHRFWPDLKKKG